MKEKEFNLSEKSNDEIDIGRRYYWEEDIKEFIKRLKEEIKDYLVPLGNREILLKEIDKLAGEKLI